MEKDKEMEFKKSNTTKYWIIGTLLLLALTLTLYSVNQYYKSKKDYIKFTKIIESLEKIADSEKIAEQKSIENEPVENL